MTDGGPVGPKTSDVRPPPRSSLEQRFRKWLAGPEIAPTSEPARREWLSGFWLYALRRALLIPAQLAFILLLLYFTIYYAAPTDPGSSGGSWGFLTGFLSGFWNSVVNDFTGNWGPSNVVVGGYGSQLSLGQLFAYYIPTSVQIALFALPISVVLAYPLSLLAGWSRRPGLDGTARYATLIGALLPAFVVGTLVLNAVFFAYLNYFQDVPSQGLIPSTGWFIDRGGYPSWILYDSVTQPTGFPLIDAVIHQDWPIAAISVTKTLIQATVVAVAYVAIFFRHARSVVRTVSQEVHIVGARARGISERTLLWRHTARRVTPSFFLIFALTIPEYLLVQFAVETAFTDENGFGFLTFHLLTYGPRLALYDLVFLLAILILIWVFLVDLIALRLDPRGVLTR
jgi:ABC-type dipeptide/oligopeptide/nickel transport system permease component